MSPVTAPVAGQGGVLLAAAVCRRRGEAHPLCRPPLRCPWHAECVEPVQLRRRRQTWPLAASAASSPGPASRSVDISPNPAAEGAAPWQFGYQCNERYLKWDVSAQRQLIVIWVAQQLDVTLPEVEGRLAELALLLPDLTTKLDRLQAKLVLALIQDLPATTARILDLRRLLPSLNLSALLSQHPWLLLELTPQQVAAQLASLAAALPASVDVERLVAAEPMFLRADIHGVLAELRRLVPGRDPVVVLLADPSGVLDMQSAGLKASLEIDHGIPAA